LKCRDITRKEEVTMSASVTDQSGRVSRTALGVIAICWLTIMFDGYDVIMYGTVVPQLLAYQDWALTPGAVGIIGALALFGMLLGALGVGPITDTIGRKKTILIGVIWTSLGQGLCAVAPTPELLGLFRFITGLGLGGILPAVSALTLEYSPISRRNLLYSLMFAGYEVSSNLVDRIL
jgi:AAHS family benzoate transporter-like MFS transporter